MPSWHWAVVPAGWDSPAPQRAVPSSMVAWCVQPVAAGALEVLGWVAGAAEVWGAEVVCVAAVVWVAVVWVGDGFAECEVDPAVAVGAAGAAGAVGAPAAASDGDAEDPEDGEDAAAPSGAAESVAVLLALTMPAPTP
ncbi:hypothetical protein GCM10009839_83860 [Catenulispora yoronensis]|uniref:Uncharacterized protein n=1 Tax=Catenulispora yoronensis TaxID=450799 RepID=A0ABP5GY40_9ACTN